MPLHNARPRTYNIPDELHNQAVIAAASQDGMSTSEFVRQAIEDKIGLLADSDEVTAMMLARAGGERTWKAPVPA